MGDAPSHRDLFSLMDKVIVVTGASSGLGARWAPVLAACGASVVISARREPELMAVAASSPGMVVIAADLTSADDRSRVVDQVLDRFGRVDVLVNSAGTAISAPATDISVEDFR